MFVGWSTVRLRGAHPRYFTHTLNDIVFFILPQVLFRPEGRHIERLAGCTNLTSEKRSLPAAQQIFNLQGGPSGIEHLRKGAGSAMDRGRDPPSGGSSVLVPWTLGSRKKKLQSQSKGNGAPWCRCPKSAHVCITVFVL